MFFAAAFSLGLAASAAAGPFARDGGLVVSITSAATTVAGIEDIFLTASVTNNNAEVVKVLRFNTVLDTTHTKSFSVFKGDTEVKFIGARVQVSIPDLDESNYATIGPGETVSVAHKVANLYDFEASGPGAFKFEAQTEFQMISVEDSARAQSMAEFTPIKVAETIPIIVEVTSDVARRHIINPRARTVCSNASQASFITASLAEAKTLASRAASYINAQTNAALYTSYFKTNSRSTIAGIFSAVANENTSTRTLNCVDSGNNCGGGVIAYTIIATTNIYYCSIFFQEVATSRLCSGTTVASRSVRGGTTLHELTHAVDIRETADISYGCQANQALSAANQRRNADNYNCYSTQVYQNTGC